ncbi:hypothetical protein MKX07_000767 [Trichoderma sp. CBMAI-0711]|nr:hypothetical protein MKX07_000767 [Trichoderma sp. CBMAI-0711]
MQRQQGAAMIGTIPAAGILAFSFKSETRRGSHAAQKAARPKTCPLGNRRSTIRQEVPTVEQRQFVRIAI